MLAWSQPSLNPTTTPTPQPPLRRLQVSAGIRLMPPSLRDQRGRPTLRSRIRRIEELALHFAADAGGGLAGSFGGRVLRPSQVPRKAIQRIARA